MALGTGLMAIRSIAAIRKSLHAIKIGPTAEETELRLSIELQRLAETGQNTEIGGEE